ncbi:MAG: glycosyltransferase family 2 protein [Methanobacteriota archaeon]
MKSTLVILSVNEIGGLQTIYEKIPINSVDEVFAMDGGSTDGTLEFYERNRIRYIIQKKPGRGSAILEAPQHAKGDILVYFSPDGNEDPDEIPKLVGKINEGYDLAIASRFINGGLSDDSDDPLLIRRFGNNFFTFLSNIFFHTGVTDAINGLRAIRKKSLLKLDQDASGHEIEFQMTIRCALNNMKIAEIPTHEDQRIIGKRKANTWIMGVRFSLFFLKELWKSKKK